jgi:hypothetical protein
MGQSLYKQLKKILERRRKNVKKTFKLSAVLLSILAIVIMMFPCAATAAAPPTYPTSIDGMPVILVETSANDVSLSAGQVILVLLDKTSAPMSASDLRSMTKSKISNYLNNNPISGNPCIQVYGGPGITKELILKIQMKNNDWQKKYGSVKLGTIDASGSGGHAFQIDVNSGTASKTRDRQSCNITAPNVTPLIQNNYSYFGINVRTNGGNGGYFLQSGQYYGINQSFICYADDNTFTPRGERDAAKDFLWDYHPGDV